MRKMSKKIIVSVLTLVLTVVALGTTTYAWFTVGGTVAVEEFEMKVTSGVGLEIAYVHKYGGQLAVDDPSLNYVKTINANDLYAYLFNDYYGYINDDDDKLDDVRANIAGYASAWKDAFRMDAVTSANGRNFSMIPENFPKLDSSNRLINDANLFIGLDGEVLADQGSPITWDMGAHGFSPADKLDGFIEFTLAFRTKEAVDTPLYINELIYRSDGMLWKPEKPFEMIDETTFSNTDTAKTFWAVNGTRISLTDDQNIDNDTKTKVFEKVGAANVNNQLNNLEPEWNFGAHNFYEAMTNTRLENYYKTYRAVETSTSLDADEVVATFKALSPAGTYNYALVTIRIYLEGFDSETFNAIFDDVIKARFGFNIKLD